MVHFDISRYHPRLIFPALVGLSLATLAGCSSEPTAAPTTEPLIALKGKLTLGHEVSTFSPCNSDKTYWVVLPAKLSVEINKMIKDPAQYRPLYAEVKGKFQPVTTEGFETDYDATFAVAKLNMVSREIDGCRANSSVSTAQVAYASGNEPFWSLRVQAEELDYRTPIQGAQKYQRVKTDSVNQQQYHGENAQGEKITLTLTPKLCRDSMSDTLYGWKATLTQPDGTLLHGCAKVN